MTSGTARCEGGPVTEMTSWAQSFAAAQRAPGELVPWVERTSAAILAGVPEIADSDLAPLIHRAVEEHWLAFLDGLFSEASFALVGSAGEAAVELARRHLGLPVLLRIYRIAQETSWDFAIDVIRHAPADLDHEALLVWFWGRAAAWFNASVDASVLLHQAEVARIRQAGDAERFEIVTELLAGTGDPVTASARLGGHPLTGPQVGLVAHALTAEATAHLEPALLRVAARLGRARPLVVRPGGREVWAWLATGRTDLGAEPIGVDGDVRVTLGGPMPGLDGFVAAHRDAIAAQRVALADRRGYLVTAYEDVAALALLAGDHPAAERFARRTLGALAEPSAGVLRETARAVLSTPGGAAAIASRLAVHGNTVRYRVGQLERLLGRPLPERAGDLLLALDYYDAFLA
jgi:hypothetical protein